MLFKLINVLLLINVSVQVLSTATTKSKSTIDTNTQAAVTFEGYDYVNYQLLGANKPLTTTLTAMTLLAANISANDLLTAITSSNKKLASTGDQINAMLVAEYSNSSNNSSSDSKYDAKSAVKIDNRLVEFVQSPYRCTMRGICADDGIMAQNCEYNGPPMPLPIDDDHIYRELCPQLFANDNIAVCCNREQFQILRKKMAIPQQLLSRCPSCYSNFVNFWCQFTCSPIQYNFVHVVETRNNTMVQRYKNRPYITRVEYYLSSSYVMRLFESCRNVRTTSGDYVLAIMCGTNVENCTPEKLFKFLGTYNKAIDVPFTIDVLFNESSTTFQSRMQSRSHSEHRIVPMNAKAYNCDERSDVSDYGCSCVDCLAACVSAAPFPILFKAGCKMAMMDCTLAMGFAIIGTLVGIIMCVIIIRYVLRRYTTEEQVEEYHHSSDYYDVDVEEQNCQHFAGTNNVATWRLNLEERLVCACANYGRFVANNYQLVFFCGFIPAVVASFGIYNMRLTTDPVELWSSAQSKAREQRDFFNKHLTPFYRTEHFIIVPRDQRPIEREDPKNFLNTIYHGPVYRQTFLESAFLLYLKILSLTATMDNGEVVRLENICFKPLYPLNNNCAIYSLFNYFQNNITNLYVVDDSGFSEYDYVDHLFDCTANPYTMDSKIKRPCLGEFNGPIPPYVVLGDFSAVAPDDKKNSGKNISSSLRPPPPQHLDDIERYKQARGLVNVLLINNFVSAEENAKALAWEKEYIRFMRSVRSPNYSVSFIAERSLEDEIERQSSSDAFTVIMSYVFMFIYVAFALGQYQVSENHLCSLFINSKFVVGICGIVSVTLSVSSSVGIFALYGMPASLLILEVEPFLVLAVGVDNIFIFVQSYQRLCEEVDRPLEERIALICSEVMPSMLLSSLSECLCFCFGSLSEMPAVQAFSLYAALAIFFNFFLQITVFLAVFVWDIRRQEAGRLEVCCCVQMRYESVSQESFMYKLFKNYYAPNLFRRWVRSFVIMFFFVWLCSSLLVVNRIKVGLEQKMAVPEDSYVLTHFINMDRFLSVGPVVYFVLRGAYDFESQVEQTFVCASVGCSPRSLGSQLATAAKYPERSYIALPAMNWLDDYVDWLRPLGVTHCCRQFRENGSFCSPNLASEVDKLCKSCDISFVNGRPSESQFYKFLPNFLSENPSMKCARAGHAAYGSALRLIDDTMNINTKNNTLDGAYDGHQKRIVASHFMTYHTVLKNSEDYINAMQSAMLIAQNITRDINTILKTLEKPMIEVFPYSPFYVFYEQYHNIVRASIIQILLSLASIFCVSALLLGADPWSAFIIVIVISLILMNVIGLMYWWSIDFNAISVVNLVMSIGISVEFCAHIVRTYTISVERSRVERASEALSKVGCSVLSGITLTKLGGIVVLAFAHSQIFNVYYFRMFLGIVAIGAAHGLVLLPVLLSYCGPPVNRHRLFLRKASAGKAYAMIAWLKRFDKLNNTSASPTRNRRSGHRTYVPEECKNYAYKRKTSAAGSVNITPGCNNFSDSSSDLPAGERKHEKATLLLCEKSKNYGIVQYCNHCESRNRNRSKPSKETIE